MSRVALIPLMTAALFVAPGAQPEQGLRAKDQKKALLEQKGYVVPARTLLVVPELSGRIAKLSCEEGMTVKRGDVLAVLDPRPYELAYRQATAEVEVAKERLAERATAASSKEGRNLGHAAVDLAEVRRDLARYRMEQTQVRAPMDGVILSKKAEEGGIVDRLQFSGYVALCEMADLRQLEVDVWVGERDLPLIRLKQACAIRLEAFPQTVYQGEVTRFLPVADRAKGAIGVRVSIRAPQPAVRPEMGAVVAFLADD
jgi:RND family efflux transporter MFP subunit